MTELEIMLRAKMYMDKLAQGVDPITDQELTDDTVLNNIRLARCFFYVSQVLDKVIANGGVVGGKTKMQPFAITQEQLSQVRISQKPIRISQLVERIMDAAGTQQQKKLATTVITNWLLEKGFLEKVTSAEGKTKRVPTQNGCMIGLRTETFQGHNGTYTAVLYDASAQQFVLDNLSAMLK